MCKPAKGQKFTSTKLAFSQLTPRLTGIIYKAQTSTTRQLKTHYTNVSMSSKYLRFRRWCVNWQAFPLCQVVPSAGQGSQTFKNKSVLGRKMMWKTVDEHINDSRRAKKPNSLPTTQRNPTVTVTSVEQFTYFRHLFPFIYLFCSLIPLLLY